MPTQGQNENIPNSLSINKKEKHKNIKTARKNILDFRKYTQQIWLAGLGAFSRAEEEGSKFFENLVKMGEELEVKSTDLADQTAEKAKGSMDSVLETKDKLLQQSLNKVGLATHKDIQHLEQMILQLHHKLDVLIEENQKLKQQLQNKD